jgi:mannose-6-phosphate isomerase-like protein (cupin superfamily)
MKFELNDQNKFEWEGLVGHPYNSKEDFANASAAFFEVTGSHGKVKNTKSDRIYFVVSGQGKFIVGGKEIGLSEKDVVIIPKNTMYDYWSTEGILKLFLVHTPAYDSEFEVRYERNERYE